ncbi:hypothetical protein K7H91_24685 [Martelella mediterranea]|uniref:hypothetical protein n=1 Tax=Martelella mediterranea TaxID=293089 RepID=UPI001E4CEF84|nr:hypothetical protein [Martelella mediterranea]MCD1636950.1 hypothetical protein [Martelella mediterranea]
MMNPILKSSAGLVALSAALALSTPGAHAFDSVNWVWDAAVTTTVDTAASAITEVMPTGLEQVESEQQALGSMSSVSAVTAIDNALISGLTGAAPVTDLAAIDSSATSMGNSAALTSDVQMAFDAQQSFGGIDVALGAPLVGDIADLSLPGLIDASSSVIGVLNASVDSAATGVANNLTAKLETTSDQDAFAIGNNVQTALATMVSLSTVDAVSFGGFSDLGTLDTPAINSAATAVGNNFSVEIDGIN